MARYVLICALIAVTVAQDFDFDPLAPRPAPPRVKPNYSGPSKAAPPPPVAIIKQINRHNEDGSYTYGYESADGSFKIETKLPTGEVKGKYGYVDDVGKVRVIEYGATKHGFAPSGEGITVPPPTLVDETTNKDGTLNPEYSGAYDNQDQEQEQQEAPRSQLISRAGNQGSSFEFTSVPQARPAPRPAARPVEYSPPQTFEPAPVPARANIPGASQLNFDFPQSKASPAPSRPAFSPAPVPPRPTFTNAIPSQLQDFGSIPSRPAPAQPRPAPQQSYAPVPQESFAPQYRPAPAAPQYRPAPAAPQYRPAPAAPQYRPAPVAPAPQYRPTAVQPGRGSILDQLSKDYALPQGDSAPLHDISFGYY